MITSVKISGLTCSACQKLVEKRLKKIQGVQDVLVELNNGNTAITANRLINDNEITKALEGSDYKINK